jgi:hypothetical protein
MLTKAAAVRIVRALRAELDTEHGTVQRIAQQLGSCFVAGRHFAYSHAAVTGTSSAAHLDEDVPARRDCWRSATTSSRPHRAIGEQNA